MRGLLTFFTDTLTRHSGEDRASGVAMRRHEGETHSPSSDKGKTHHRTTCGHLHTKGLDNSLHAIGGQHLSLRSHRSFYTTHGPTPRRPLPAG
jgi:hypothetical protein